MFRRPELIGVGLALAGVMASFSWFGLLAESLTGRESVASSSGFSAVPPVIHTPIEHEQGTPVWLPPRAQRRSSRWVYDVFTPPEIFYDASLKAFSVTPPTTEIQDTQAADGSVPLEPPFALRLVAVERMPFRLQLIGFVKTASGCLGLFENKLTAEIFLARRGETLPGLSLVIEEIEVLLRPALSADDQTNYQPQARALVRDPSTNECILLMSTARRFSDITRATLATAGTQRQVGAGDVIESDGEMFQIGAIELSPAAVIVTRSAADGSIIERRTLRLPEDEISVVTGPSI